MSDENKVRIEARKSIERITDLLIAYEHMVRFHQLAINYADSMLIAWEDKLPPEVVTQLKAIKKAGENV